METIKIPAGMWYCSECGSTDVETLQWVDVNTGESRGEILSYDPQDCYCNDCGIGTELLYADEEMEFTPAEAE